MKFKVKSFELKNSAPAKKSKKLKSTNKNITKQSIGGIKDKRNYAKDNMLSEAKKISSRMALENMKRDGKITKNKNQINLKSNNEKDEWENDELFIKIKQIEGFDEGLDESSDEDDEKTELNTEKYFNKAKKTLADKIRESKIEKYETNTVDHNATIEANKKFRDEIRFILPNLAKHAKINSKIDKKTNETEKYSSMFQKNFETLIYAERPQKVDQKTITVKQPISEKENVKLVEMKIKKLRKRLVKEGIDNDGEDAESDLSKEEDDDDEEELAEGDDEEELAKGVNEDEDNKEEIANGENEEEDDDDVEELSNESSEEENQAKKDKVDKIILKQDKEDEISNDENTSTDDEEEASEDYSNIDESDNDINNNENDDLKQPCGDNSTQEQVFKSLKEKLDDFDGNDKDVKRTKLDENKTEFECFRVILEMPDLRKDALYVLASEMRPFDIDESNYKRKLLLAILLQEALKSEGENCYSPELIGLIKYFCQSSTTGSESWLSIKSDLSHISSDQIINISDESTDNKSLEAISIIYHVINLLISVISANKDLANKHSLFVPFLDIFQRLPSQFYPDWLKEKLCQVTSNIDSIKSQPIPILRMKKNMKLVELLEPELADKFDPTKNITKSLKDKIKKERKSIKKVMKLNAQEQYTREINEAKKLSKFRNEKTKEIMNNIRQK